MGSVFCSHQLTHLLNNESYDLDDFSRHDDSKSREADSETFCAAYHCLR